jgi:hypothetical protein
MIHYIVAVYVGTRGNKRVNELLLDPTVYVKKHLECLSMYSVPKIKKVTFVVSPSEQSDRDSRVMQYVEEESASIDGIDVSCVLRPNNKNFSYGSWNHGMARSLDEDLNFFLIEDDYFPNSDYFYEPFIKKLTDGVAYVTQWYRTDGTPHAAISNGLMSVSAARAHHSAYGECINLSSMPSPSNGNDGVLSQLNFLKKFHGLGMSVQDLYKEYCHPFLTSGHTIINYGKRTGTKLIVPSFYEEEG